MIKIQLFEEKLFRYSRLSQGYRKVYLDIIVY